MEYALFLLIISATSKEPMGVVGFERAGLTCLAIKLKLSTQSLVGDLLCSSSECECQFPLFSDYQRPELG